MANKVTTKRKAAPAQEEIPESIFDVLNANPPGGKQDGDGGTKAKADTGPSMQDILAQLKETNTRLDAAERANIALSTAAPVVQTAVPEPKLDLEGLPDPVDDPKKYAQEIATRTANYNKALNEHYSAAQAQKASQSGDSAQLWDDFSQDYGAYAEDQEGVEFATAKVIKAAQRRGMDVNKYMYQNSDRFFRDVAKAYDTRFGKPEDGDGGQAEDPAPRRKQAARREEPEPDEPNRTGGIFGGIDSGGGNRAPKAPAAGDMVKDLQDIQRKTGYY